MEAKVRITICGRSLITERGLLLDSEKTAESKRLCVSEPYPGQAPERMKKYYGFWLFLASAGSLGLLVCTYQGQESFFSILLVAIAVSTFMTGLSCMWEVPPATLKVCDFLYYGTAILGVIFLFEAQRAERNTSFLMWQLSAVRSDLELALAERSKLERISQDPTGEIESSIDAILKGLYEDADEEFDRACERSKKSSAGPGGPGSHCYDRDRFYKIRNLQLSRFQEMAAAFLEEESDAEDLRAAALSIPERFLGSASAILDEASYLLTVNKAVGDLELALSAKADRVDFRRAQKLNQAELRDLQSQKRSREMIVEQEVAAAEQSSFNRLIQWVRYKIWPYLLIFALSIKLARMAQD